MPSGSSLPPQVDNTTGLQAGQWVRLFGAGYPPELTASAKVAAVGAGHLDLDRGLPFASERNARRLLACGVAGCGGGMHISLHRVGGVLHAWPRWRAHGSSPPAACVDTPCAVAGGQGAVHAYAPSIQDSGVEKLTIEFV